MLTKRQRDILAYIENFLKAKGYSPSLSDIAGHLNIRSLSTVHKHLRNLEARGVIHRGRGSRSIQVVEQRIRRDHEITLMGTLSGKPPIHTTASPTTLIIPPSMQQGRGSLYALRVEGDTLHSEGLHHGDYLICEERHSPTYGEQVLAVVNGERMVCRRYDVHGKDIRLDVDHSTTDPMVLPESAVRVQGIIVGLLRHYRGDDGVREE